MKSSAEKYVRFRTTLIGLVFTAFFAVIAAKAAYLQIFRGTWLSEKAANQYEKSFMTYGKRGSIFDRQHRAMAVSNDVVSIAAHPSQVENINSVSTQLARKLRLSRRSVRQKLNSSQPFVWLKRHVTPSETKAVRDLGLKGIVFKPEQSRFYPNKTLAAQVLGFSGIDGNGLEGIEFICDDYLKGEGRKLTVLKDALGREIVSEKVPVDDRPSGKNVILTIDRTIQYITEKALEEAVSKFSAKSGIAIVMVPRSGAILALAHVPLFNANAFSKYNRDHWRNRAITDPFEPGSTLKIFSAAAALESGAISPQSIFFCENGKYRIGNNTIHDTHSYGWLTLQKIVKYSSNIGIVKVGEITGAEALYKTLSAFGFGDKTGIDCPGETAGNLLPYRRWTKIDAGAIAFGQGISVSAIQLITAVSAIANDGVMMKPYVIQAITDQNGGLVKRNKPTTVRRVISVETARTIKKILTSVTDSDGTGIQAALNGYTVSGKTGTAQKTDEKGTYADEKFTASFIGFTPATKPELAILVVVDEPRRNHYGGVVAAPAFRQIAQEALNHLNIPPDKKVETLRASWQKGVSG